MLTPQRMFIGLDLGQAQDFTALVVLSRPARRHITHASNEVKPPYALPFLKRFPLGTPYPEIVTTVIELFRTPELRYAQLILDRTGVGRAVSDLFQSAMTTSEWERTTPVTITSGHTVKRTDDGGLNVPKVELVSAVQVLLQTRRLRISNQLPEAATLVDEFQHFKVTITDAANESYGVWRTGQHDDLVLATALAAWYGEQMLPLEGNTGVPMVYENGQWRRRG